MKIAYIVPNLAQTGPMIVMQNLVRYLKDKVDKIHVYYIDERENTISIDAPTEKLSYLKPINFDKYDIIHCHCAKSDLYAFLWKYKMKHAKVITTIHQDTFITESYHFGKVAGRIYSRLWLKMQSRFDGVVCISEQVRKKYQRYFNTNVTTIYNGVHCEKSANKSLDQSILSHIQNLHERYVVLGTYALIVKRKGLEQILKFIRDNAKYAFVIIGDGPEKVNLIQLTKIYNIQNRVLFVPHINQPYNYMSNVDIYTMPSYSEGFGLAMVEAALQRKAIVCSDLPSFHEIFTQDEACFFELRNEKSLHDAIIKAVDKKELLSKKAFERCQAYFTADTMANNYLAYYNRITEKAKVRK